MDKQALIEKQSQIEQNLTTTRQQLRELERRCFHLEGAKMILNELIITEAQLEGELKDDSQ